MASKDRPSREQKKPKKDAKAKIVAREEPTPVAVEVVKRKRKERLPDED
jgi:hypothetical protein